MMSKSREGSLLIGIHDRYGKHEANLKVGTLRHASLYSLIYTCTSILTADTVSLYPLEGTVRQCLIVPH